MNKWRFIILSVCIITLAGCAETKILERISITTLIGYDLEDNDKVSTTAVIRQVNPEFESKVDTISAENYTSKGTRAKINLKTSKKIMAGQLRVVLLGDELVKNDIGPTLESLSKDPDISSSISLAVVEGKAKPLIEHKYENIKDIGQHIYMLLEQNVEREHSISSTLHEVSRVYYSPLSDLILPVLKKKDDLVEISGIAFFNDAKMVGQLPSSDGFFVKISRDNYKSGILEIIINANGLASQSDQNLPDEVPISIDAIKTVRKLKLIDSSDLEFDLNIKIKGRILELHPDVNVGNPRLVKELEKAIDKKITSEISRVIAYSQEINADVYGFGEHYRSHVRNSKLTSEKWHEIYPKIKVNVQVDFETIRSGVFE
ncbi:Ger(x)C family spore germination protein [Psychrobacillus sp. FJAT-51614]|uniref:Ger(X)C family spore germination protein n=1 Tax=Psychrobacillus mangrovi TaxID=3117745 RepID=A0ABU8F1M8_9BACI